MLLDENLAHECAVWAGIVHVNLHSNPIVYTLYSGSAAGDSIVELEPSRFVVREKLIQATAY